MISFAFPFSPIDLRSASINYFWLLGSNKWILCGSMLRSSVTRWPIKYNSRSLIDLRSVFIYICFWFCSYDKYTPFSIWDFSVVIGIENLDVLFCYNKHIFIHYIMMESRLIPSLMLLLTYMQYQFGQWISFLLLVFPSSIYSSCTLITECW